MSAFRQTPSKLCGSGEGWGASAGSGMLIGGPAPPPGGPPGPVVLRLRAIHRDQEAHLVRRVAHPRSWYTVCTRWGPPGTGCASAAPAQTKSAIRDSALAIDILFARMFAPIAISCVLASSCCFGCSAMYVLSMVLQHRFQARQPVETDISGNAASGWRL